MNNNASPPSTNSTKKCRALFSYFPSSEGRLAGEHTVVWLDDDVITEDSPSPSNYGNQGVCRLQSYWDELKQVFMLMCKVVVKIVRSKWKLTWLSFP
jgi:hypothetical protein